MPIKINECRVAGTEKPCPTEHEGGSGVAEQQPPLIRQFIVALGPFWRPRLAWTSVIVSTTREGVAIGNRIGCYWDATPAHRLAQNGFGNCRASSCRHRFATCPIKAFQTDQRVCFSVGIRGHGRGHLRPLTIGLRARKAVFPTPPDRRMGKSKVPVR
jgi:hypothetical protein